MGEYLMETPSIDFMNPLIQDNVQELRSQSEDEMDYLKRCCIFVNGEHLAYTTE